MKRGQKLFLIVTAALFLFVGSSCQQRPFGASEGAIAAVGRSFSAMVLEKNGDTLTVVPAADSEEIKSADRFVLTLSADVPVTGEDGDAFPLEEICIGQMLEISYDGTIRESYPAQITPNWVRATDIAYPDVSGEEDDAFAVYDLPALRLEYTDGSTVSCTNVWRGTAQWSNGKDAVAIDTLAPLDLVREGKEDELPKLVLAEGHETLTLLFSSAPDRVELSRWRISGGEIPAPGEAGEAVSLTGMDFCHPIDGETYLYEVSAHWTGRGDVSYSFILG